MSLFLFAVLAGGRVVEGWERVLGFFTCFLPGFKTRLPLPSWRGMVHMNTSFCVAVGQGTKAVWHCSMAIGPWVERPGSHFPSAMTFCSWQTSLSQGTAELLGSSGHIQGRPKPLLVRNLRPSGEGDENSIYMLSLFLSLHMWAEYLPWQKSSWDLAMLLTSSHWKCQYCF